jgi:hypothetical protein
MADKMGEAGLRQRICEAIRARHEIDFTAGNQMVRLQPYALIRFVALTVRGKTMPQGKWHDFELDQISGLTPARRFCRTHSLGRGCGPRRGATVKTSCEKILDSKHLPRGGQCFLCARGNGHVDRCRAFLLVTVPRAIRSVSLGA